jgi:hypothetical protein
MPEPAFNCIDAMRFTDEQVVRCRMLLARHIDPPIAIGAKATGYGRCRS